MRKILLKAGNSSKRIFLAFRTHASSSLPKNKWDPLLIYANVDFSGKSFMLNPHELINNSFRWKLKHIAEYIALASYRNYARYAVENKKTLDLLHSPASQGTITNNPLLRIIDDQVYFYYEEDKQKREKIWH